MTNDRPGLSSTPDGGWSASEASTLAARQADLVAALVRGAPPPAGFDPAGVGRTARTLIRKRWAAARRHWPVASAAVIGSDVAGAADAFAAWAVAHRTAGGLPLGGFADGYAFLTWLEAAGRLPDQAATDLARARLFWGPAGHDAAGHHAAGQLVPRRWRGRATASAQGVSGLAVASAWGSAARPRAATVRTKAS